jgi:hypothetical protein
MTTPQPQQPSAGQLYDQARASAAQTARLERIAIAHDATDDHPTQARAAAEIARQRAIGLAHHANSEEQSGLFLGEAAVTFEQQEPLASGDSLTFGPLSAQLGDVDEDGLW